MVIIFKSNLVHDHSLPHELGHSFSLPHTFQGKTGATGINPYHSFHRGYTENYMDYSSTESGVINRYHSGKTQGPFTFYKWQWDIMRRDKSMQ